MPLGFACILIMLGMSFLGCTLIYLGHSVGMFCWPACSRPCCTSGFRTLTCYFQLGISASCVVKMWCVLNCHPEEGKRDHVECLFGKGHGLPKMTRKSGLDLWLKVQLTWGPACFSRTRLHVSLVVAFDELSLILVARIWSVMSIPGSCVGKEGAGLAYRLSNVKGQVDAPR